jgi:hypothetical protein
MGVQAGPAASLPGPTAEHHRHHHNNEQTNQNVPDLNSGAETTQNTASYRFQHSDHFD